MAIKLSPLFKTSRWTISRRLKEIGLKPYVPRKKPLITPVNKEKRFKWAEKHVEWKDTSWQRVVFSDETPVTLFQWTGRKYCWRRPGTGFQEKHLRPTVKHGGGKIQIWGCFSWMGPGPLYRINGIMDAKKYHQILVRQMAPYIKDLSGKQGVELIFQHDNDPKHKAKLVTTYLNKKKLMVLDWVAQSPDINPIENAWKHLKERMSRRTYRPSNLDELFEIVKEEWNSIPLEFFRNLIRSMPRRCAAVYANKGGHTKY
jgi:hypothetical protein